MRKMVRFLLLVFIFCMLVACSNETNRNEDVGNAVFEQISIEDSEDIDNYIIEKGYEILSSSGKIDEYKVEKKRLYDSWQIWAVQYSEPDDYIGKVMSTYAYTVRNHFLDNESPNKKTSLCIMVCENKIIGGYSNPDYEGVDVTIIPVGGVYSLEGKNFEDIKRIDFGTWRDKYFKKYE